MSEIQTPRDLFLHELGDILFVERTLVDKALPTLISQVKDEEFQAALEEHLAETRGHVERIEEVFEIFGEPAEPETCLAFKGLDGEHKEMVSESDNSLIDLVDLGAAARTEHYEIAAYSGLRRMAKALGEDEAVELLDANLAEEKAALQTVEKLATRISGELTAAAAA